jgi:hypothetical protein
VAEAWDTASRSAVEKRFAPTVLRGSMPDVRFPTVTSYTTSAENGYA